MKYLLKTMKEKSRFIISSFGLALVSLILSAPPAHALDLLGVDNIAYSVIGQITFGISYIIAYVAGVLIAIEAWLIGVVLAINSGVFGAAIVQNGFSVTLALANLGFVLAIIVIALATILRSESYGVKKLLGKLIAAAILVNFSLVIMAPIFNFGTSLTQYFLNCIDPAGGGCNGAAAGTASMNDFAKNLAGAFNPQNGLLSNTINANGGAGATAPGIQGAFAGTGSDITKMVLPITSLIFVAAQLITIVVVLGSLVVMLLIRYLYIAILAILMPLAWLMWIFPGMEHYFEKWWSEFIRWTMFAPIVVFFLWLAMTTMTAMNASAIGGSQSFATYTSNFNPFMASIANFGGNLLIPIVQNFLNMILMVGLSIGGMFVANSMGIKGAEAGIHAAKKAGNTVSGFALKQSKKGARVAFRRAGGEKAVERMRTADFGRLNGLKKIPGVGWAVTRSASLAGRAAEPHLTNKDIVEEAKKHVSDNPHALKENLKGNMNMEDRLASIQKLIEKNELSDDVMVGNQNIKAFLDTNHDLIEKNYGQGKLLKDADKTFGSSTEMRAAEKSLAAAGNNPTAALKAIKDLDDATKAFVEKLQKTDVAKMNSNEVLGEDTPISRALSRGFARYAPHLVPSVLPKMKAPALKKFDSIYQSTLEQELKAGPNYAKVAAININPAFNKRQKEDEFDKLPLTDAEKTILFAKRSYEQAFSRNAFGFGGGGEGGGGAAPAAGGGGGGGGGGH